MTNEYKNYEVYDVYEERGISAKTGNYKPDLDASNSSALFRNIFSIIDYSKIGENYSFQKDPTGDGDDRIFPLMLNKKEK